jgi:hypothetical protein
MSSRVKFRKLPSLAGIIGRDDEPEMMPVPFAALGKGAAVYVISRRDAAP